MAGLGFKDFAVGEVLTAGDVDGYLMQQSVMRFATDAARGSALGTAVGTAVPLAEGMVAYLDDANALSVYTGSIWTSVPPAGIVAYYGGTAAPDGWLKANGANVSRTTYSALFAAIGTTFGSGDGSTTFGLPELRGEFVRGWTDGRAVDSGRAFGSSQTDDFKAHTHVTASSSAGADVGGFLGAGTSAAGGTGSTGGAETRPRNVALLACIKF